MDSSIEALAAARVQVLNEVWSNVQVDFLESHWVRELPPGTVIPEGFISWDAERTSILTGVDVTGKTVRQVTGKQTPVKVIPKEVATVIRKMNSTNYDQWDFHTVTRVTKPWKTAVLLYSPKWYENALFGNVMLSVAEVGPAAITDAWKLWRKQGGFKFLRDFIGKGDTGDLPVVQRSLAESVLDEGAGHSLVQRNIRQAVNAEGIKAGLGEVNKRLTRTQDAIDSLFRSVVFERTLRRTGSRTRALERASKALVDYFDLSPLERSLFRSVVPFYSWMKGIFKLLSRFPADHPFATPILMQMGLVREELLADRFGGEVPEAYLGLIDLPGLGPTNLRAQNPYLDAFQLTSPEGVAQAANPFVEAIVRDALNAPDGFPTRYKLDATGRPVPDVDVQAELLDIVRGVPGARLVEQLVRGEDLYRQEPGATEAVGRFAGAPRTYTQAELDEILERVQESREVTEGGGFTLTLPKARGSR